MISLLLTLILDSCNNKDIILILGYNYNILLVLLIIWLIKRFWFTTFLKGPMADCYWGEPERAPHWSVVKVYVVGASRCAWSVNKKI